MAQPISSSERAPLRTKDELHIAKRLRELRSAAAVSQAWIADTIGVHKTQVVNYEAGRTQIPDERLSQIAGAMRISPAWFKSKLPIPADWGGPVKSDGHASKPAAPDAQFKGIGKWLKARREAAGLSQRELAARLDLANYAFISQTELGRGRIPLNRLAEWADALHIKRKEFTEQVLRHYEPELHETLFDGEDQPTFSL